MYSKQYDGPDTTYYRIAAFMATHKFVAQTNSANLASGSDLRLEINSYADLHYEEFISMRGGFIGAKKEKKLSNTPLSDDVPASVDWRTQGIVNTVQDQQQCGSCWAFSATAAFESRYAQKSGTLSKFSEQQLVDCVSADQGCDGGLMDDAFA